MLELFDFNNYPEDSKYCNNVNNLVVGKMKNEKRGVHIKGFLGLKSKLYTFMIKDIHESNKTKGINKNNVDDELKFKDYKNV